MENKTSRAFRVSRLVCAALLFFIPCLVFTQEESSFFIQGTGDDLRFIQRLTWEGQEYAYRYEVIIEKREAAGFAEAIREFTTQPFIEVSLAPGEYRYGVLTYDLFDVPAEAPPWTSFEVLLALQPEVYNFSPAGFYLDEDTVWEVSLGGGNLTPQAEIYLRLLGPGGDRIIPSRYIPSPRGDSGQLVFVLDNLTPGAYEVYVKNPGGLEASRGTFTIAYRKPVDLNVSLNYAPLVPLYGALNDFFDAPVFPLAVAARISFVPFKRVWGYLGVELVPFWTALSAKGEGYEVLAQYMGAHANLLYQKWLPNRTMAFNFRLGGGMVLLDDLHFEFSNGSSESLQTLMPSAGAGLSFMWFVNKPFFVELGAEYLHFFSVDNPSPGYLRPIIGGGYQW
jgi:hypothetical protein